MVKLVDPSQLNQGELIFGIVVALSIMFIIISAIPSIKNGLTTIHKTLFGRYKKYERQEGLNKQIENNTEDIVGVEQKINDINGLLTQFIVQVNNRFDGLNQKIDTIEEARLQDKLDRDRSEILTFVNRVHRGKEATLNEYHHIFEIAKKYHRIIKENNIENDKFSIEYEWLKSHYEKLVDEDGFVTMVNDE